ncbi:Hsp33 family molecular chaperone [Fructilactobacillus sanfranciscensis]|uniref:33 kDa chaperonin n=1 Tax=Fructilactobacillus sanfranciscensis (strain TMW 1.1304) TaxID=714313 RepID=G2KUZ1_FRUST|nr:Hsp33 family molecular chaperone HslO [Fructilactobacillus sanfranciscensis]AEN98880.1 33 kDa chaperonin [Fructilactobacillus sanfranciscensis TMW 1.1304]MCG7194580.1 Hsp33 family molecular chaperone HslO [Fructilactobacillus sanfranciscensis]MCG7196006.1 Hsp33 family molecular chaperone HslO [Fructilactobacillus sanfranciscensis]NDR76352.1 Hsp33 family molecular chaperone HslO [Fructilactobacillus sanfranciscensis]NDR96987.1 Hsp33 family molecular chaperone HslO [Fructilactobacillus sanfra
MKENDVLVKALTKDQNFRVYAINATGVVDYAQKNHDLWSTSAAALGRTLVATLLLSNSALKGKETMTVRLNGQGPVGFMVIDADANGHIKGYIQNPHINLPLTKEGNVDVAQGVGTNGFLEVLKNQGGKEPYTSSVPLASGKIGDDFTYYLAMSEQIPSVVGVSVDINGENKIQVAGGFLIQTMPGADDDAITKLEKKLKEIPSIPTMLAEDPNPEHILDVLFGKDNLDIVQHLPVSFECNCSKEKFAKDIAGIGKKDLQQLIDEDHGAEIVCNFCGKKYNFSEDDLIKMMNEKEKE